MPQNLTLHGLEPQVSDAGPVRVLVVALEDCRSKRVVLGLARAGFNVVSRRRFETSDFAPQWEPFAVAVLFVDSFGDDSDRMLASVDFPGTRPQVILVCQDLRLLPPDYVLRVFAAVPQDYNDSLMASLVRTASTVRSRSAIDQFCVRFQLSPRERGVIELFCEGRANKEIADKLDLSERTVDEYWKRIFAKTQRRSQREIVALLLGEHNLPQTPAPGPTSLRADVPAIRPCQYFPRQRFCG